MVEWPSGWGIRARFGTEENFANYQVAKLLKEKAAPFKERTRLVLLGETLFGPADCPEGSPDKHGHTMLAHETMSTLGIRHTYQDDLNFTHSWRSKAPDRSWLKPAVAKLMVIVNTPAQQW